MLKPVLAELVAVEPKWKSVHGFGCGPGVMIDYMNEHGYDYIGCDYSKEAYALYVEKYGKNREKY